MESINYQFHVFAGYILFPLRLLTLVTSTLLTIGSVSLLDSIGCKSLGKSVLLQYGNISTQLFGLTIHREGLEHLTDKPCIIVGNHINFYDHYVMTDILYKLPVFISEDPLLAIVKGTGKVLNDIKNFSKNGILINT